MVKTCQRLGNIMSFPLGSFPSKLAWRFVCFLLSPFKGRERLREGGQWGGERESPFKQEEAGGRRKEKEEEEEEEVCGGGGDGGVLKIGFGSRGRHARKSLPIAKNYPKTS